MLLSERTGLVGSASSRQTSFFGVADDRSVQGSAATTERRARQHGTIIDWQTVQPSQLQLSDSAPAINERYSETSSFDGRHSGTGIANEERQTHRGIENLMLGQRTFSKYTLSDQESKGEVLTEKADTQAVFVQVNPNGKKTKGAFKLFKSNHPRLRAPHSVLFEHESQVRRTKKIIQVFLKSGKEILFGPKAENLRGLFRRILTLVRVAQIFKRSHSIGAEQVKQKNMTKTKKSLFLLLFCWVGLSLIHHISILKHRLIRDLSSHRYDMEYYSRVRRVTWMKIQEGFWRCTEFLMRCGAQRDRVLMPTSWENVYFTAFQLIFNSFALYYASIFIVFDFRNRLLEIETGVQPVSDIYTFNVFVLVFTTFLDIIKGFNTAYYSKGETITDRRSIAWNYLGGNFIFDALSLISVIMNRTFFPRVSPLLIYRLQFLFFFKLTLIVQLIRFFKTTFIQKEKYDNLIQLIRLMLILCLTSHINAILYHTQAQLQIYFLGYQNTWIDQANLVDSSYMIRYINSFYCAVGTLVTSVIYQPQTTLETAYMSLSLLINCCIFGYLINELGNIMGNIERASKNSKKELRLMNSFLQTKKVKLELQTRIRNYLEYLHREEKQLNLEETKVVINKLSGQLKQELMKEVNAQYILSFELINQTFSQKIQEKSLLLMRDQKYTPGEIIFKEGQEDEASIYLVWEGQVDIFHTNQRQEDYVVQTITCGQSFGEIAFFSGAVRSASARSSEFTSLIQIQRKEFMHLLKEYSQEDYEIFQQISHTIQQSKDYSQLSNNINKMGRCYTCGSVKHMAANCSLTHFAPLPVAVALTSQRMIQRDRVKKKRWSGERWRPVSQFNLLRLEQAAIRVEENYEKLIDDLGDFFGEISDQELDQSDQYQQQQQLQQQQQQQQQHQPSHFAGHNQGTLTFDKSPTNGGNGRSLSPDATNDQHQNHRINHHHRNSVQIPPLTVSFANEIMPAGIVGLRHDSIKDTTTSTLNWGGLRRFETQHFNLPPLPQQQGQSPKHSHFMGTPNATTNTRGQLNGSLDKKSILKQSTANQYHNSLNASSNSHSLVSEEINNSHNSSGVFHAHNTGAQSQYYPGAAANNNLQVSVPQTSIAVGLGKPPKGNLKTSLALKKIQAMIRLKASRSPMKKASFIDPQPTGLLNGGGMNTNANINSQPQLATRSTLSRYFSLRDLQNPQNLNQQEELLNPNLPHPLVQALLAERQSYNLEIQQNVLHSGSAQDNRFGDPYADLVEVFRGKVSLNMDFMRNFAKYFFKSNIEEIEKTAIGKKAPSNEVKLKKDNSLLQKKGSNFKKSYLLKSKIMKGKQFMSTNELNRSSKNRQSSGSIATPSD